jgi:hypothetical protein
MLLHLWFCICQSFQWNKLLCSAYAHEKSSYVAPEVAKSLFTDVPFKFMFLVIIYIYIFGLMVLA